MTLNLSYNSLHVLSERYLKKDSSGKIIETPEQLFERVSSICKLSDREKILYYLKNLYFLPNSPTLMNAGSGNNLSLSACYVLPVEDSMRDIFTAKLNMALIHQSGGGTGFNFSHLRPESFPVKSTGGKSSGPISFMKTFNSDTEVITQGGKRRGANMGCLNDSHPDILNFISCKNKDDTLNNFNISITVTDAFMSAVKENKDWNLTWKDKIIKTIKARDMFSLIVENAHSHGDPGLLFIDEANRYNPTPELGKYESSNPCGEEWLLPFESCNLSSINLTKFITLNNKINYPLLSELISQLVPFMNDVIDANNYVIPEIKEATLKTRKIGIGIMGWADLLIKLKIPYNSLEAISLAEELISFINSQCHEVSKQLYDGITELNKKLTTIAPTGTISIIADCSSGIEPIFAIAYKRNLKDSIGKDLIEINQEFLKVAKERNFYSEELIQKIIQNHGSIQNIPEIPIDVKKLFLTAHDLHWKDHINIQSAFQKYTDSAVSKTINLPESATKEDVWNAYMYAYEKKCKGITIYRNNSKNKQVLVVEDTKQAPTPRIRYKDHIAVVREIHTGCGVNYNTLSFDPYGLFEDFSNNAGKGGCRSSQSLSGRYASTLFRHNVPVPTVIKQTRRADPCPACITKDIGIKSCADGVAKHMSDYYENKEILNKLMEMQKLIHKTFNINGKESENTIFIPKSVCPNCGSTNIDNTSCGTCHDCGETKCL